MRHQTSLIGIGLISAVFLSVGLAACSDSAAPDTTAIKTTSATYYLVRHAEKVLEGDDPALTAVGEVRAQDLAKRLHDTPLTHIYSTNTKRTRDTAGPTAEDQGLDVTLYDASDLSLFAEILKKESGEILVVGHSNTTPNLVDYLDGNGGEPINEALEYDRFYTVKRSQSAEASSVKTIIGTFGQESPKP